MELTSTEFKVADLVSRGLAEKEVAAELFVSEKTIHTHTYNIRKKNNLRNNVDMARMFILNLENPKQYFAAMFFLIIQIFIVVSDPSIELRRSPKTQRVVSRTMSRSGRKHQLS